MKICEDAFNEIINFIASQKAESGGALFGSEDDYIVRKFIPDRNAITTGSTYSIDADYLNRWIKKLWDKERLSLIGIIHSHPKGVSTLSGPDLSYFRNLLDNMERQKFLAPIVHTVPDGGFKLYPYILNANGTQTKEAQIEIVPDDYPTDSENYESISSSFKTTDSKTSEKSKVIDFGKTIITVEALLLAGLAIGYAGWFIISLTPPLIENIKNFLIP